MKDRYSTGFRLFSFEPPEKTRPADDLQEWHWEYHMNDQVGRIVIDLKQSGYSNTDVATILNTTAPQKGFRWTASAINKIYKHAIDVDAAISGRVTNTLERQMGKPKREENGENGH